MKKFFILTLVAFFFVHHAVADERTAVKPLPYISKISPAISFTINEVFDITLETFVPCAAGGAGEVVLLEGRLHSVFHVTINNNMVSMKTHFQPQGITDTGLTTGDKYQATGVTQERFNISLAAAQNFTYVNNFRIMAQGRNNNFLIHENVHVTVNANGTMTASVDNFTTDCK